MKIGYSETFPLQGQDRWQKNWLEDEVNLNIDLLNCTDEDIAKAMLNVRKIQYALQKQVQSFFFESKKSEENKKEEIPEKKSKQQEQAYLIAGIYASKDIQELDTFKTMASTDKLAKQAFDVMYEKLNK